MHNGCYLLSLQFDHESNQAQSELYYINSSTDGKIPQPSIEQAKAWPGSQLSAKNDHKR